MVSRRNFASITVVMAIIFFLFQFLNLAKSHWNDYKVNQYVQNTEALLGADSVFQAENNKDGQTTLDTDANKNLVEWSSPQPVACIGTDTEKTMGAVLKNWALYMKRSVAYYESLDAYERAAADCYENIQFLLIDPDFIDWDNTKEIRRLQSYVENGVSLIFGRLPDVTVIDSHKLLRRLLGIEEIRQESVQVEGIHLYSGFLLGGEAIYKAEREEDKKNQDLNLTFPWYQLSSGTKVYMKGMLPDASVDVQEYPVLIWRRNFETASVFAINGDYLSDATGLGILTGMLCEMQSYTIYPVINAQNFVVANYPGLANENAASMQQLYSQTMQGVMRDIIWPTLSSINIKTSFRISSMLSMQFDYSDDAQPNSDNLSYYMEAVNEEEGEMGYSGACMSDTSMEEKLAEDEVFWNDVLPEYQFSSFYSGDCSNSEVLSALETSFLKNVRTVVQQEDNSSDIVGFFNEKVTRQKVLIDGYEHTYSQDLRIRGIETALGYTSVLADINRAAYPQSDEDGWEKLSEKLMANTITYWEPFTDFEGTTVSQCDTRIRRFLAMNYQTAEKNNKLLLTVSQGSGTAWFLLRTNGQNVAAISGGSAEKIEEDVWLIGVESASAMLTLESSHKAFYYE